MTEIKDVTFNSTQDQINYIKKQIKGLEDIAVQNIKMDLSVSEWNKLVREFEKFKVSLKSF